MTLLKDTVSLVLDQLQGVERQLAALDGKQRVGEAEEELT